MAGGYFTDGAVEVELGEHVFATPSAARRNVLLEPAGRAATVLDAGGGLLALEVTGQRLRENLGDAERYVHQLLVALATSGAGELGCEDNFDGRAVFGQAVCRGAVGRVHAFRFVDLRLDFVCPEKSAEPEWDAIPSTPGTYPGTATLQDYTAGGVQLGHFPAGMTVEMQRDYLVREIPRARGARARGPARGGRLALRVTSFARVSAPHLAAYLEELARQIGPGPVELTANGNTYPDVVLRRLEPRHTDGQHTAFEAEFVQEV